MFIESRGKKVTVNFFSVMNSWIGAEVKPEVTFVGFVKSDPGGFISGKGMDHSAQIKIFCNS